jgi:cytochrome c oxidase assembly protein subunit 15
MSTVARLRQYELSPAGFLRYAWASLAAVWLIVSTGAAVRLTDSGLGCRHWPGCEAGHPLPAKDSHAFIEFGNRVVGGGTIVLTLAAAVAAWRTPVLQRSVRRLALAVFVGALAQAPLGALAVATDLRWPIVMAHLLLSILLLGGAVVVVLEGYRASNGEVERLVPREVRGLGLVLVGSAFGLVVSGTLATAGGPHSGGGKHIQRLGRLEPLVYAHAVVVGVFACSFLFTIGYLASQRHAAPRLFRAGVAVLGLLLVQMAIGEVQYQTHLPWWLVLVHVGLAATVWAGTVALVTLFWRPSAIVSPRT